MIGIKYHVVGGVVGAITTREKDVFDGYYFLEFKALPYTNQTFYTTSGVKGIGSMNSLVCPNGSSINHIHNGTF